MLCHQKVTQSIPMGKCLESSVFNLAMTAIPGTISNISGCRRRDYVVCRQVRHACTPTGISVSVCCELKELEVSILLSKTSSLLYRRRRRLLSSCLSLFLGGERVCPVERHRCLGSIIDDRVSWHPAVADVLTAGRRALSILRKV